ncbi:MAG: 50S ribosomal protein L21e [Candidatus Woesearchaeota archaeon]
MMRVGGSGRKSRSLKRKNIREKGKIKISQYLQEFNEGDKVMLIYEPSVHEGRYHHRFYGKVGTICGKQGDCYIVKVKDLNAEKKVVVHPVHLKKLA